MEKILIIKENKEICFSDGQHIADSTLGVVGEKNAAIIKFIKPQRINDEPVENFTMRAVFNNESGSIVFDVKDTELALGSEVTAFQKSVFCIQFLKNSKIKWSSFPINVYFLKGVDDSGENVIEKAKSEQRETDRAELSETLSDLTEQDLNKSAWNELIDVANELPLKSEQDVLDLRKCKDLTYAFERSTTAPSLITGAYNLEKEEPDEPDSPDKLIALPYLYTPNAAYSDRTPISAAVVECGFDVSGSADTICHYNEVSMFNYSCAPANCQKLTLTGFECVPYGNTMFSGYGALKELTIIEGENYAETYDSGYWKEFFRNCSNLQHIEGTPLDMSRGDSYLRTFQYCSALRYVNFKKRSISHDLSMSSCVVLTKSNMETIINLLNGFRDWENAGTNSCALGLSSLLKDDLGDQKCHYNKETGDYISHNTYLQSSEEEQAKYGPEINYISAFTNQGPIYSIFGSNGEIWYRGKGVTLAWS